MSEKVKLPKNICDALDWLKKNGYLVPSLTLGYEPEVTPEERIKKIWDQNELVCDFSNGIREGIKQTLLIYDIKYDWLNGELK